MAIQAIIETKERPLRAAVLPLARAAKAYPGHLNYAYSKRNDRTSIDWCKEDIQHRNELLTRLRALNTDGRFIIGHGSGHIWVSLAVACSVRFERPIKGGPLQCIPGDAFCSPEDRLLLIVDAD